MANKNRQLVHMNVHQSFFDNIFEPERKKISSRLGLNKFTQADFTEYLVKSGAKIHYPKAMKMSNTFSPRFKKRGFML